MKTRAVHPGELRLGFVVGRRGDLLTPTPWVPWDEGSCKKEHLKRMENKEEAQSPLHSFPMVPPGALLNQLSGSLCLLKCSCFCACRSQELSGVLLRQCWL